MTTSDLLRARIAPLFQATLILCLLVGLAAAGAALSERWLDPQSLALFFVPSIVIVAIRFGLWPSILASLLSASALNFLFVEPRYTFVVARGQDAAALALFSIVALLASAIAARARSATVHAELQAQRARLLQELATRLAACGAESEVAEAAVSTLGALSGKPGAVVAASGAFWGEGIDPGSLEAARWSMSTKQAFVPSPDAPVASTWRFWPVLFSGRCDTAIGVNDPEPITADLSVAIEQIAAQVGLGMERARSAQAEQRVRLEVERERLKSELLAGVSHDLRTPLSTIVFTLESLRKFAADHPPETQRELLELAETEARRLAGLVDDLLDASRIGAGGAPVRIEAASVEEVIARACAALGLQATTPKIVQHIHANLPRVAADPTLAARALGNVLQNALRHGGGAVEIEARLGEGMVVVEVRDRGPGLGAAPEHLFEPFVRGAATDGRAPGLGLGLTLARSFLRSQGGRIAAQERPGGGAVFILTFPIAEAEVGHAG